MIMLPLQTLRYDEKTRGRRPPGLIPGGDPNLAGRDAGLESARWKPPRLHLIPRSAADLAPQGVPWCCRKAWAADDPSSQAYARS